MSDTHQIWSDPVACSIVGTSHAYNATPCQDAFAWKKSYDGKWTAICVSDGAGSAKYGGEGAGIVVNDFLLTLLDIADKLTHTKPGSWINDAVIHGIINLRSVIKLHAQNEDLSNYHSTLLGLLIGENGGFYVHIGDGAILGNEIKQVQPNNFILHKSCGISKPENGEYANETFFITEPGWFKHLRINPLPKVNWLILATDGGLDLVADKKSVSKKIALNNFFIPNLLSQLKANDCKTFSMLLSDEMIRPEYDKLTSDDKTIVFLHKIDLPLSQIEVAVDESNLPTNGISDNEDLSNMNYAINDNPIAELESHKGRETSEKPLTLTLISLCIYSFFVTGYLIISAFKSDYPTTMDQNHTQNSNRSSIDSLNLPTCSKTSIQPNLTGVKNNIQIFELESLFWQTHQNICKTEGVDRLYKFSLDKFKEK